MTIAPRLALAIVAVAFCAGPARGQAPSGQDGEIVLGMSTALTGPAAELGLNMRAVCFAAFAEVNRSGGVHGRRPRLVSLNDAYEPSRTAPNMRKLIGEYQVLAVVENVGIRTAVAAIPLANAGETAFFGVVIMVGAYQPCATFIMLAKEYELDAIVLNMSFVCSAPLAQALGVYGDGAFVTQAVPHIEADLSSGKRMSSSWI